MDRSSDLSVLCVDNEPDIRDFVIGILSGCASIVYTAVDGVEGLEAYHSFKPDVVITDVRMPRIDGLDMIRAIREIDSDVRIVVASAHRDPECMVSAIELGVDYYLFKPIDKSVLLKVIEKCGELKWLRIVQQQVEERLKQSNETLQRKAQARAAELERAFAVIERSQKQWQETFDNIGDLIAIVNSDYELVKVNKAFASSVGLHPRDVIGTQCYSYFCDSNSVPPNCPHSRTILSGEPSTEEVRRIGDGRLFQVSCFPYRTEQGVMVGSIHIARDITEEKEREMRTILNERFAMLGQMASGIAHEINNPLASIAGCCDAMIGWVKRREWDPTKLETYLTMMREEVFRCKNITTSMLSLVKTKGHNHDKVDLSESMDRALELIGFQGRLRQVEVVRRYQDGVPPISVPGGELRQVLLSLLTNALDAMEDVGCLTLETGADGSSSFFRITDTGSGIPPENLNKIYDSFYTTKAESGGTGLGLSISSKIVSELGGAISVVSTGKHGTTFQVSLPHESAKE